MTDVDRLTQEANRIMLRALAHTMDLGASPMYIGESLPPGTAILLAAPDVALHLSEANHRIRVALAEGGMPSVVVDAAAEVIRKAQQAPRS